MSSGAGASAEHHGSRRRPRFHYAPSVGWINDPIAGLRHGGRWHLFVQANPDRPRWGLMRWRHLVSDDLVGWSESGLALEPTPDSPDEDGCWSGSVSVVDARPVFFYTAARGSGERHRQAVIRATAADDEFTRLLPELDAPLLTGDDRHGTGHQRDPFLLRWNERWLMLLGTGLEGTAAGGAVVAWTSDDGDAWRWHGMVFTQPGGDPDFDTGAVWECPQLVPFGDTWVLIVSVQVRQGDDVDCVRALWFSGEFDGERFRPTNHGVIDAGNAFYAPSVIGGGADPRCLLVGWLQESPETRRVGARDYSGALSVVRELRVARDVVSVHPIAELDAWFEALPAVTTRVDLAAGERYLIGRPGSAYRLQFRLCDVEGWAGVVLGEDGARREVLVAVAGGSDRRLVVGELIDQALRPQCAIDLPDTGLVEIDVFVDGSIVEAFAGGRAISVRVDPSIDAGRGVWLVADGPPESVPARFGEMHLMAVVGGARRPERPPDGARA